MEWIEPLSEWAESNDLLIRWLVAGTLALVVLMPIAVSWAIIRLPVDYFTNERRGNSAVSEQHAWWPLVVIGKNLLGAVLLLAGLMMLVLPGQGLLTIAVGVMLVDFPGKFRLERWLATRPPVWRPINWLRKRAGREPLKKPAAESR